MPDGPGRVAGSPLGATFAGLLLFVTGLGIAGATIDAEWKERELRRGSVRTEGTVVAQIRRQTANGADYAPLIAFATTSGERISFTGNVSNPTVYFLGARVSVMYARDNPSAATIDHPTSRLVRHVLAAGAALLLMCLGAYVARYASRWDATSA